MRLAAAGLAGLALLVACAGTPARPTDPFPSLPQAEIAVATQSGTHLFQVWIAADNRSRTRGLMHVRELPADRGMLFLFQFAQPAAFWMKDTPVPLDLVFIDPTGRVLNISPDARPFSLTPIVSDGPVIAVLEVLAGTAARIGLAPGDLIKLPTLRTTSRTQGPAPFDRAPGGARTRHLPSILVTDCRPLRHLRA